MTCTTGMEPCKTLPFLACAIHSKQHEPSDVEAGTWRRRRLGRRHAPLARPISVPLLATAPALPPHPTLGADAEVVGIRRASTLGADAEVATGRAPAPSSHDTSSATTPSSGGSFDLGRLGLGRLERVDLGLMLAWRRIMPRRASCAKSGSVRLHKIRLRARSCMCARAWAPP